MVTDGVKLDPLAGVAVTAEDEGGGMLASATTDPTGKFSVTVTAGPVQLALAKPDYTSPGLVQTGVGIGETVQVAVTMNESASGKPSVALAAAGDDFGYGATVPLSATASDPDSDPLTYTWSNATDPVIGTVSGTDGAGSIVMPTMAEAFAPRVDPTNPGMNISGYTLQDRFGIVPIITDTRGQITATVKVNDGRGQTASASLTLNAASLATSVPNVPINQRLYVNSGHDGTSAWTLTVPAGSTATLDDPTVRTPSFVNDVAGEYTLSEGGHTMTIYSGTWRGMITGGSADNVTPDATCLLCHQNLSLPNIPDKFTPWLGTGHATMFARGIDGDLSPSYSGACIGCHTVGDDPGVNSDGFDEVAAAAGWTFPTTLDSMNWTNMVQSTPQVAQLANIQCENCHGPQGGAVPTQMADAHMKTWDVNHNSAPFQSPRISYSAEACATCHGAGAHHTYSEWATPSTQIGSETGVPMAHSNRVAADTLGTSATTMNSNCGRCHTAQGYTLFTNLLAQDIVTLTCTPLATCDPKSLLPTAATLALVTSANAEPVTCTACHDPHDATNPHQLRIYDSIAMTPAGFSVNGMGEGALCISCHNSRNGTTSASSTATFLHEDTASGGVAPTSYSAPHVADQGDVFEGHNAYFMGANMPMLSKHAAIANTCVGCHMTLQPATYLSHGSPAHSEHLFRITDDNQQTLCANCHGATVDGLGIQNGVLAQLAALRNKASAAVIARAATVGGTINVTAYDETDGDADFGLASKNFAINTTANPIVSALFGDDDIHGQIALAITLTTPISIVYYDASGTALPPVMTTRFSVQLGSLKDNSPTPVALYAATGNFTKAGWNYFLIQGDQSKGLHNPSFVNAVINNTLAQDLSN
ncbi:MAG TPA: cytochrome c3 family protein [Kofleriaceae bacterium]|nr:cytochrome c3 family protein [Kofleriaceae bacterium]